MLHFGIEGLPLCLALAEIRCVREDISTFHPLEFLLCEVEASREVAMVFGIAYDKFAVFSLLDG